ncbi:NAD(P)H-binding protein [Streptomyces sp. NPDC006235]|uniref:NAD(P)H-binding protein n=1 Tax=Streptomyces sp. NPDC006235 TaxID=3156736 RepID=UPI0033AD9530
MAQQDVILVTGATGNVGRQVVHQLLAEGRAVRALVRNPDTAGLPDAAEVFQGDFTSPETLRPAVAGVDAAFLVWPSLPLADAPAVVDVLAEGTGRIVYLSSAGVEEDKEDQGDPINQFHAGLERLIEKSGAEWTFLRSTSFAASLLEWADQVREGVVREAFGEATRTLVHEADLAAVAVRALTEDAYVGRKLMLSGTAPISQIEQVRIIGEVLGRPVRFEEIPLDTLREQMRAEGWTDPDIDGMFAAYATMATMDQPVWNTVEEVTGRPARTFRQWVADHAQDFR